MIQPRASYDVVIVGAGVAGALAAWKLAEAGRTVALIEAGRRYSLGERLQLLRHFQIMGGLHYPWLRPGRDDYVDDSRDSLGAPYPLQRMRVKGVGGSTLHWGGRALRLMASDFRTQSTYGTGVDWPITYDDLEHWYCEAESALGVSGIDDGQGPRRSRDFPLPGFPLSIDEQWWLPVAQRVGVSLRNAPFAINSRPYDGRSDCKAFASCYLCPSGARYSADFHVARAEATGNCDVFAESVARRVDANASGVVKAVQVSTLDGRELELRADRFIVAAHAVESARLLLLSGVGNASDQVGRNFMEHLYVESSGFLPDSRFHPSRVGYEKLESLHYYDGAERVRERRGAIKLEFYFSEYPGEGMERLGLWGERYAKYDREHFGHRATVKAEIEMVPRADSRITLDPGKRDQFGDPVPRVRLALGDIDRRTLARGAQIGAELLHAAGAGDPQANGWPGFSFAAHHIGTCRMSAAPELGVVDANLRVHETRNLFAVGSGVFPTGGALQPTLTIAALSLRLADHLLRASS